MKPRPVRRLCHADVEADWGNDAAAVIRLCDRFKQQGQPAAGRVCQWYSLGIEPWFLVPLSGHQPDARAAGIAAAGQERRRDE